MNIDPQLAKAIGFTLLIVLLFQLPRLISWLLSCFWEANRDLLAPLMVIGGAGLIGAILGAIFLTIGAGLTLGLVLGIIMTVPKNNGGRDDGHGGGD